MMVNMMVKMMVNMLVLIMVKMMENGYGYGKTCGRTHLKTGHCLMVKCCIAGPLTI